MIKSAEALPTYIDGRSIITLNSPMADSTFLIPIRNYFKLPLPSNFLNLTSDKEGLLIYAKTHREITLENANGILKNQDLIMRDLSRKPFKPGDQIRLEDLEILILSVNHLNNPITIKLKLDKDHDEYLWFIWQNNDFIRVHFNPSGRLST